MSAFEAALEEYKKKSLFRITGVRLKYFQAGWSARDSEIAAKDARIAELERRIVLDTQRLLRADEMLAGLRVSNKELQDAINASRVCVQEALR